MNTKKYIEGMLTEILKQKPIDKIKVNEVIREVGTCKGTFYKYYRDKYELLVSCFQNNYYDKILSTARGWEEFIYGCLSMFEQDAQTVLNAFDSKDVNSVRFYHESLITAYLEAEMKKNGNELGKLGSFSMRMCASCYTDIMLQWLSTGRTETKEELITYMRAAMPQSIYPQVYAAI